MLHLLLLRSIILAKPFQERKVVHAAIASVAYESRLTLTYFKVDLKIVFNNSYIRVVFEKLIFCRQVNIAKVIAPVKNIIVSNTHS